MYVYIQGTYKAPGPAAKVHSGPFKLPGEYNCYWEFPVCWRNKTRIQLSECEELKCKGGGRKNCIENWIV